MTTPLRAVAVIALVASLFAASTASAHGAVWEGFTSAPTTSAESTAPEPVEPVPTASDIAVRAALTLQGAPYVYGGSDWSHGGFDCSGLTSWAYRQAGISIPRSSAGQYRGMTHIATDDRQVGDIVYYVGTWGAGISHVGIYIGNDAVMMAIDYGKPAQVVPLFGGYWGNHLAGFGRM